MSEDTFFEHEKHKSVWYQPPSVYHHVFLKDAAEAVELWMEGKIRRSPCNLHDIAACKHVITGWIGAAEVCIQMSHKSLEPRNLREHEKKYHEICLKKEEEYLKIFKDYLDELPQYLQEAKLSLAMASHRRLGNASLLSQLSPDNLRWIAEFLWD